MKKFTRIISFVIVCVMLFASGASAQYTTKNSSEKDTHAFIDGFYAQPKNSIDVVLLGSSALYRYYLPMQSYKAHGFTSYQFASTCQSFDAAEHIFAAVSKRQKPKLYVVEIRSLVRSINSSVYGKNKFSQKSADKYNSWLLSAIKNVSVREAMAKDLFPKKSASAITKAATDNANWAKPKAVLSEKLYKSYTEIRSLKSTCAAQGYKKITNPALVPLTTKLPKFAKTQIDEIAKYIKEKKINVLFVSSPYRKTSESISIENALSEYFAKKGIPYINGNNYYKQMKINFNRDFYNAKHTNILGAQKFTKFLSNYIVTNYSVKSTHTKKVVDSWNKAYAKYVEVEKTKTAGVLANIKKANQPKSTGGSKKK